LEAAQIWQELASHYFPADCLEAAQIWRELAPYYFPADCFGGGSNLAGTGSILFSSGLFWRQLRFGGNWLHIIFQLIVFKAAQFGGNWLHIEFEQIVLEAAQIWRELAPHYFPVDCFGGSSDLAGTGSTLFSGGLFWRQLRFGRNWLHIIFQWIVLKAAHIWWELAPHYFWVDCFEGSSHSAGTGSTFFWGGLFWRQLRFGRNWLHIIFMWIVLEAAQIWQKLAPYYFPVDCFEGSSGLAGTGFLLFSGGLFSRWLRFGGNWLHIIFWRIVMEAAQIWREPQQKN
jgi:hypothetical protein